MKKDKRKEKKKTLQQLCTLDIIKELRYLTTSEIET
jgi:hypothetical protein